MSINDKLAHLKEIKGNIKTAIIEKGVEVSDTDSFNSYADKIRAIPTGSGPVVPLPEIVEWEKPADWIDIKTDIPEGAIRYLISDMFFTDSDEYDLTLQLKEISDGSTVNWGDGTVYTHSNPSGPVTTIELTHKFDKSKRHVYIDENGFEHGQYMVEIIFTGSKTLSRTADFNKSTRKSALWCVNNFSRSMYFGINMKDEAILECYEFLYDNVSIMNCSFQNCYNLKKVDLTKPNMSKITNTQYMFNNCYSLQSVDVSNWDTSKVTSMLNMFSNCYSLQSVDVSNWDTSSVTSIQSMFSNCYSLQSVDVSNWDTSKVTSMSNTFSNCYSLQSVDVSNWDTSSVTSMNGTFINCYSLQSVDVSNWDTSSVTSIQSMFNGCYSLQSVDASNWDTSKMTYMTGVFGGCYSLQSVDVSNWDTSSVTSMNGTFGNCYSLQSVDVSNWDTSSVTSMSNTFGNCYSLQSVDLSNWDVSSVTDISDMFENCYLLKEVNRTKWDFSSFTGSSSSSKCSSVFSSTRIKSLDITFQNSVDQTRNTYLPIDTTNATYLKYIYDFSLTIPRPTYAVKITMGSSSNKNYNLQRLIVKGQDTMDFTAASPQIDLQYTYAFKEDAINEFFTNLPVVDPSKNRTISLKNNPHAQFADITIATGKGWVVLYDAPSSTYSLRDRYMGDNTRLYYRLYPTEEGQFVNANGESCNLLWTKYIGLNDNNAMNWELHNTFSEALDYYGLEVQEEYREEMAKDVLAYASDDSLMVRYNIED